jgi:hypothetical protein
MTTAMSDGHNGVIQSDGAALADAIDLSRPWFAPWAPWLAPVLSAVQRGHSVADALNGVRAGQCVPPAAEVTHGIVQGEAADLLGLRFVPQSALPPGEAYEAFIFRTRCVPTRDNLHDLLNGVCWLRFPAIKRRLNALQAEQIAANGVGATRGPVRDALTLFDENAVLLCGPARLRDAHRTHDWHTLFVRERGLWAQTHVVAFGHALLEKLVQPYKSITAHVLWVDLPVPGDGAATAAVDVAAVDAALDRELPLALTAPLLATKPFMPLPVLGLPGWWPANENPDFYADRGVFRPLRTFSAPA